MRAAAFQVHSACTAAFVHIGLEWSGKASGRLPPGRDRAEDEEVIAMKKPKEIRDLEKQFEAALIVVRDLHTRAMELGVKDLEETAGRAHDALIDYKLTRDPI
jgi:hypothetical protein